MPDKRYTSNEGCLWRWSTYPGLSLFAVGVVSQPTANSTLDAADRRTLRFLQGLGCEATPIPAGLGGFAHAGHPRLARLVDYLKHNALHLRRQVLDSGFREETARWTLGASC